MLKQDCLQIGTIVKTHGIHGELIFEANSPDLTKNIKESVFLELEGLLVPFFVDKISSQSTARFRVHFAWINSDKEAKKLVGTMLYISKAQLNLNEDVYVDTPNLLLGFQVIDTKHGELGVLTALIENSKNPLMIVQQNNRECLIPFHRDWIQKVKLRKKQLFIETPDGLLDL